MHRRGPGPVDARGRVLRRDGDAARKRKRAVKSVRVREAKEREARAGKRAGGGSLWFGYVRVFANPDEPVHRKRVILREELHPVNASALRDAAERILRGESVGSIIRDWDARGITPVATKEWSRASLVDIDNHCPCRAVSAVRRPSWVVP